MIAHHLLIPNFENAAAFQLSLKKKPLLWETYATMGKGYEASTSKRGLAPRTDASSKLYNLLLAILAFGFLSFLVTTISAPMQATNASERNRKQTTMTPEFLGKKSVNKMNVITPERPPYHVVFSTSCDDQQDWESFVFFYHAHRVKQPGTVTRIASGCSAARRGRLQVFHEQNIRPLNENFHVHFTPGFARREEIGKARYKYMNKPFGLRHWLENVLHMNETDHSLEVEDGIVILMDPDMILLRPIVHDYTNEDVIFVENDPQTKVVKHGFPMAQQDAYLSNEWMYLNISHVTNGGSIKNVTSNDGPRHYNSGPPYLATVRDMYNIVVLWTEYTPRVYQIYPRLFAEMYGYIIATAQLELPHTLIKSFVISTTTASIREGWSYVDSIPEDQICSTGNAVLPVVLHYCKRYILEKWFFSKYRLKKKYISCETPLLVSPPLDLATKKFTFSLPPPPHGHDGSEWNPDARHFSPKMAKREAFMICALISSINEAAVYYKKTACRGNANMVANYTFWTDPEH